MCQAASGVPGPGGCGSPIEFDTTSAAGTFSHSYTVRRFISVPDLGRTVDCLVEQCLIEAAELSDITTTGVATEISFASFPPPAKHGTLTASPRTHLHNDDVVTVAGRGFTPNATVQIAECNSAPHDPTDCLGFPVVTATTDPSGAFTTTLTVARSIPTICDSAPGTCTIAAGEVTDFPATVVTVPLTFVPIANTISVTPTWASMTSSQSRCEAPCSARATCQLRSVKPPATHSAWARSYSRPACPMARSRVRTS